MSSDVRTRLRAKVTRGRNTMGRLELHESGLGEGGKGGRFLAERTGSTCSDGIPMSVEVVLQGHHLSAG